MLRLVQDAPPIWHKDVGGKKKCMRVEVELKGKVEGDMKFVVSASLYFENGKRVSDEWQSVLAVDNDQSDDLLDSQHRRAEIFFRLEKVSTSFMRQKFKVRLLATRCSGVVNGECLDVYTTAIESKAKPKRCSAGHNKRHCEMKTCEVGSDGTKRRRRGVRYYEATLEKATQIIQQTQHRLVLSEAHLELAVDKLQDAIAKLSKIEHSRSMVKLPFVQDVSNQVFTKLELTERELSTLPGKLPLAQDVSNQVFTKLELTERELSTLAIVTKQPESSSGSSTELMKVPLNRISSEDWPLFCFPTPSQSDIEDIATFCCPSSLKPSLRIGPRLTNQCVSQMVPAAAESCLEQIPESTGWLFPCTSTQSESFPNRPMDLDQDPALERSHDSWGCRMQSS